MTTDEVFIEGVALGVRQIFGDEKFFSIVAQMAADALAKRFELLDPTEAANLLRVTAKTLTDNHREWGLDKSVAFGAKNPRYFLSQILERAAEKTVNGRLSDSRTIRRLNGVKTPPGADFLSEQEQIALDIASLAARKALRAEGYSKAEIEVGVERDVTA